MAIITPVKNFTYTDKEGQHSFEAGQQYDVPDEVASHWFVGAHLANAKPAPAPHSGMLGPRPWAPYTPNQTKEPVTPVQGDPLLAKQQTPPPSPVGSSGGPAAPDTKDDRTLAVKEAERFGPGEESKNAQEAEQKKAQQQKDPSADEALENAKREAERVKNAGRTPLVVPVSETGAKK